METIRFIVSVASAIFATSAFGADGDLDLTFGTGGKVATTINSAFTNEGKAMALQSDGKILLAGHYYDGARYRMVVVRYTSAGLLDSTFGNGGIVTTLINPASNNFAYAIVVQPDGRILVAGYVEVGFNFAVVRYNTDGSLDTSFGTGGAVTTDMGGGADYATSIALQSTGKIVVGGYGFRGGFDMALARYHTNGTLDTTFGTGGKVFGSVGSGEDQSGKVIVLPDDRILVGGYGLVATMDFAVLRFTANGALDPSFGTGGIATIDFSGVTDYGRSIAVQGDGKIVVVGEMSVSGSWDCAMTRLNSNGTLDTGFATNGRITWAFGGSYDMARAVAVQYDGKIVVTGWTASGFGTARFQPDGTFDSSFGTNGKVVTSAGSASAFNVLIQPDSKILIGGRSSASAIQFALVRYLSAPILTAVKITSSNANSSRAKSGDTVTLNLTSSTAIQTPAVTIASRGAAVSGSGTNWIATIVVNSSDAQGLVPFSISYQGVSGNPGGVVTATSDASSVTIDSTTQAPMLLSPAAHGLYSSPLNLSFSLPEAALAGSLKLDFVGTSSRTVTLATSQETSGAHGFSFNPANPLAAAAISNLSGGTTIPDGTYTLTLRYQDTMANAEASFVAGNVRIDTTGPTLSLPGNLVIEATSSAGALVTYSASANDGGSGVAVSSFAPASGSLFAIGTATVNASATDNAGNTTMGNFSVTVRDTTAPVVIPPANLVVEATSSAGARVTYAAATASDAVGVVSLTYLQASGTIFLLGVTTVTVTATDGANNPGTATFTVTVRDTTKPAITPPANQIVEATSAHGAEVKYPNSEVTDAVGVTSVTYSQQSGKEFAIGTTTVTITAKDAADNTGTATFTVTVRDSTKPKIVVPANRIVEATSADGALVNYPNATATDAVGVTSLTYSHNSGTNFPIGTTTVMVTAKDAADNTGTATFTVTVRDSTAPVVTPPANQVAEATSAAGAVVNFPPATVADGVQVTSITYSQNPGTTFPLGTTTVTVTAGDAADNTDTATFTVTVRDTTRPLASVPAAIALSADPNGTVMPGDLTGLVSREDLVTAVTDLVVTQSPDSSAVLPLGAHVVTFTVRDAATNTATVKTTVTVSFDRAPTTDGMTVAAGTGKPAPATQGLPAGAVLSTFGTPAVNDLRTMAARVGMLAGKNKIAGIYTIDGAGDDALPAFQGGAVPDENGASLAGVTFKSFLDPVLAPGGAIAFAATVSGANLRENQGVWTDAFGPLAMVLRKGGNIPGMPEGAKLKSVTSLSLRDGELLVLLTLAEAIGVATADDDTVLLRMTGPSTATVLLREGSDWEAEEGATIKRISVLQPAAGSPGQGRWHAATGVLAKVTLSDGRAIAVKLANGTATELITGAGWDDGIGTDIAGLGLPAMAGDTIAAKVNLALGVDDVTPKYDELMAYGFDGKGVKFGLQEGLPPFPPGEAEQFASFQDPVVNDQGYVLFMAKLRGGGVTDRDGAGLWYFPDGPDYPILVRLGDAAPDQHGVPLTDAVWSAFTSYALPDGAGAGPVFLATLSGKAVKPEDRHGLWAMDSQGKLRLLLRTNDELPLDATTKKKVARMTLLDALPGSFGARRSYNSTGSLAVLVTFDDKTQALLRVEIP